MKKPKNLKMMVCREDFPNDEEYAEFLRYIIKIALVRGDVNYVDKIPEPHMTPALRMVLDKTPSGEEMWYISEGVLYRYLKK